MADEFAGVANEVVLDVYDLKLHWRLYERLFLSSPEIGQLLHESGAVVWRVLERALLDSCILRIARLTDSAGTGKRKNLSLQAAQVEAGLTTNDEVKGAMLRAKGISDSLRLWRNKLIAHTDVDVRHGRSELTQVQYSQIGDAILAIEDAIKKIWNARFGTLTGIKPIVEFGQDEEFMLKVVFLGSAEMQKRHQRVDELSRDGRYEEALELLKFPDWIPKAQV